ncbi:hypothetical protein DHODJN_26355 [Methylorubrum extorquens]
MAMDMLGHLLALHATPANADDRAPATPARQQGIELEIVRLLEAKRGFVPLPRRWVIV